MKDKELLIWIYNRLVNVHGENKNYDYMHRLKAITDKDDEGTYKVWQVGVFIIGFFLIGYISAKLMS